MRSTFAACVGGLLVALLALAGCVESKMGEVSGLITVDGQPVKRGAISFIPVDGNAPTTGGLVTDGRYSVKVPTGNMKVSIKASKVIGKKKMYDTPDSPEREIMGEALPERYNSQTELTFEVKPGKNTKDWELKSE